MTVQQIIAGNSLFKQILLSLILSPLIVYQTLFQSFRYALIPNIFFFVILIFFILGLHKNQEGKVKTDGWKEGMKRLALIIITPLILTAICCLLPVKHFEIYLIWGSELAAISLYCLLRKRKRKSS